LWLLFVVQVFGQCDLGALLTNVKPLDVFKSCLKVDTSYTAAKPLVVPANPISPVSLTIQNAKLSLKAEIVDIKSVSSASSTSTKIASTPAPLGDTVPANTVSSLFSTTSAKKYLNLRTGLFTSLDEDSNGDRFPYDINAEVDADATCNLKFFGSEWQNLGVHTTLKRKDGVNSASFAITSPIPKSFALNTGILSFNPNNASSILMGVNYPNLSGKALSAAVAGSNMDISLNLSPFFADPVSITVDADVGLAVDDNFNVKSIAASLSNSFPLQLAPGVNLNKAKISLLYDSGFKTTAYTVAGTVELVNLWTLISRSIGDKSAPPSSVSPSTPASGCNSTTFVQWVQCSIQASLPSSSSFPIAYTFCPKCSSDDGANSLPIGLNESISAQVLKKVKSDITDGGITIVLSNFDVSALINTYFPMFKLAGQYNAVAQINFKIDRVEASLSVAITVGADGAGESIFQSGNFAISIQSFETAFRFGQRAGFYVSADVGSKFVIRFPQIFNTDVAGVQSYSNVGFKAQTSVAVSLGLATSGFELQLAGMYLIILGDFIAVDLILSVPICMVCLVDR
jgi:hypothetical protein